MRRLEDRIRQLCGSVASCSGPELANTLSKLETAMSEYMLRIQNRSAAVVLGWPDLPRERRVGHRVSAVILALKRSRKDAPNQRQEDSAQRHWKAIAEEASQELDSGRLLVLSKELADAFDREYSGGKKKRVNG